MRSIVDIMEKLDINKVNLNKDLGFPVDGKPSDVFLWLKNNGFDQFDYNDKHIKIQFNNETLYHNG